jgi:hypothetical protein
MALNIAHTRERLQQFDFARLFIEELGWSNPASRGPVTAQLSFKNSPLAYTRKHIAQLSGVAVLEITIPAGGIPDAKARAAIARDVAEHHLENLLIFLDAPRTQSLWYWVKREAGKAHARDHLYVKGQPGDLFLGKLATLVVDISELDTEGNIPVAEVANRLKAALDVERVTKKFYKEFDTQRLEFIEHIYGIENDHQRRWYASVLMNRLMFIYFLQKKLFLDGGSDNYLEDKLAASRRRGADKFYSPFLKALFFEGFARPEPARSAEACALLGKIRYLNGGLFLPHRVELSHGFPDRPRIKIPDVAFANILALFRRYSWNLNDTPGGKDDEINPDVLGYIFEKYINQKEFGAYYTRPEMTAYLCERTVHKLVLDRTNALLQSRGVPSAKRQFPSISDLLLNLDATLCQALLFDVLPSLRLLDPACGSAAFLVAAMKVLIAIYSAVIGKIQFLNDAELTKWHAETKAEHPSVLYFIKKRIITDNLFGVDIMEEATEIARLRLFLALVASAQTEDQLEPLPNIDFNILAGNSLIGLLHVDPAKFDAPASARGKRGSGQQRMSLQHTSDLGFSVETKTAPTQQENVAAFIAQRNAEQLAAILDHKNKSIELYRKHAFEKHERDAITQDVALMQLRSDIENVRREAYARLNQMLLDEFNALGIQFEQATWDDRKNDTGKPDKRPLKLTDIETLQPFHWGYEFDKVLAAGGFDGIITNPPWEIFKPQAKEFFDDHSELVTKNKMTIKEFEKEQARLLNDPEIRKAWLEFLSRYPHVSLYFRNAAQFRNQISIVNGKKAGTDINLYKLFLEQCFNLLRNKGHCGILLPTSIYSDLGAKQLRELLLGSTVIQAMFGLSNERFIFEGVDHRFKFCLLTFAKGGETSQVVGAFRMHPYEAVRPERLDAFLHDETEHVRIPKGLIRKLSPDSLSVMEFRNGTDMAIAEKMTEHPFLGEKRDEPWNFVLRNEFHITNDSYLFQTKSGPGRLPLFTGKMFNQFCVTEEHSGYWIKENDGRKALLGRETDDGSLMDYQQFRWVHRRIARNTDTRTLIATIAPCMVFTEVNSTVIDLKKSNISAPELLYLAAATNSFCVDWFLRGRVSATLNMFYLYQLPVPRLTATDATFAPIVRRAAQLICTTPEFDALAKQAGLTSHKQGVTDPAARARLRAEIDGMVAHLYDLTEDEFGYILTTFPLVSEPVKLAARNAYRDFGLGLIK